MAKDRAGRIEVPCIDAERINSISCRRSNEKCNAGWLSSSYIKSVQHKTPTSAGCRELRVNVKAEKIEQQKERKVGRAGNKKKEERGSIRPQPEYKRSSVTKGEKGKGTDGFKVLISWIAPSMSPACILLRISIRAVMLSTLSFDRARFASRANDTAAEGYP